MFFNQITGKPVNTKEEGRAAILSLAHQLRKKLDPESVKAQDENTINEIQGRIEWLNGVGAKVGSISDGYHTFDELYEIRTALFRKICVLCGCFEDFDELIWKAKADHDGKINEGYFVAGIGEDHGSMITFHIPMSEWNEWPGEEFDKVREFDGHTSADVLQRLKNL